MSQRIKITDFMAPELDVYARLTENQLLNRAHPEEGMFIAESPKVIERALDAGCIPVSLLMETKHAQGEAKEMIERCGDIPVYTAEFDVLTADRFCSDQRGTLCHVPAKAAGTGGDLCQSQTHCSTRKRGKSNQCRCYFPFGGCASYGCGASDAGMQ